MDKKIVGVIGAISGLAALDSAAQATPAIQPSPDVMNARSFAELLDPVPNAVAALRASDAATRATQEQASGLSGDVQVAGMRHHHHHHHHHRVIRRIIRHIVPHTHHHHHHHHHHLTY